MQVVMAPREPFNAYNHADSPLSYLVTPALAASSSVGNDLLPKLAVLTNSPNVQSGRRCPRTPMATWFPCPQYPDRGLLLLPMRTRPSPGVTGSPVRIVTQRQSGSRLRDQGVERLRYVFWPRCCYFCSGLLGSWRGFAGVVVRL